MALFGEAQSRIVVSLDPGNKGLLEALAIDIGVPFMELGFTGGPNFKIGSEVDLPVEEIYDSWSGGLEEALAV